MPLAENWTERCVVEKKFYEITLVKNVFYAVISLSQILTLVSSMNWELEVLREPFQRQQ